MPNGFLVLNEKDWEKMTPEQREWATFNTLQSMNFRLNALESKGFIDKTCSAVGGVVGGFLAFLGLKITG